MATIDVVKFEKQAFGKVKVSIEARTPVGRYTFPVDIDDCGSAAANEDQALRELQRLVEDLAAALLLRMITALRWASLKRQFPYILQPNS